MEDLNNLHTAWEAALKWKLQLYTHFVDIFGVQNRVGSRLGFTLQPFRSKQFI